MFLIYSGEVLIGRSALEAGDPPMGVAGGGFLPTDAFASFRAHMIPAIDGRGKSQSEMRVLSNLRAKTANGTELVCSGGVEVFEYGTLSKPFGIEVFCSCIEFPPYAELFPHHVKAYEDQFKKPLG